MYRLKAEPVDALRAPRDFLTFLDPGQQVSRSLLLSGRNAADLQAVFGVADQAECGQRCATLLLSEIAEAQMQEQKEKWSDDESAADTSSHHTHKATQ